MWRELLELDQHVRVFHRDRRRQLCAHTIAWDLWLPFHIRAKEQYIPWCKCALSQTGINTELWIGASPLALIGPSTAYGLCAPPHFAALSIDLTEAQVTTPWMERWPADNLFWATQGDNEIMGTLGWPKAHRAYTEPVHSSTLVPDLTCFRGLWTNLRRLLPFALVMVSS